jgi:hypothetical protein
LYKSSSNRVLLFLVLVPLPIRRNDGVNPNLGKGNAVQVCEEVIPQLLRSRARRATTRVEFCYESGYPSHE